MRIAVLAGIFPSLSTTFILDQIATAIDHGHDVDVYASRPGDLQVQHREVQRYGLMARTRYFRFQHAAASHAARSWAIWRTLLGNPRLSLRALALVPRREQLEACAVFLPGQSYDVIHCHFASNALRVIPALDAGLLRGKLLVTFHGYDIMRVRPGEYAPLFARDCRYTANTKFLKERAVSLGCPQERIMTLPMGVETSLFRAAPSAQSPSSDTTPAFADQSSGVAGALRVLTVARLVEFKGIDVGLRAFAQVLSSFPDATYEICGDGPLRGPLQALANELGIANRVIFHGAQAREAVLRALRRPSVFLMPGIVDSMGQCEAQGVVLLEAQACGVPVVASRVGGMPEVVLEGQSAYLVRPGDVDATAKSIIRLLRDRELRERLGQRGRRYVTDHFEQKILHRRLLDLYDELHQSP